MGILFAFSGRRDCFILHSCFFTACWFGPRHGLCYLFQYVVASYLNHEKYRQNPIHALERSKHIACVIPKFGVFSRFPTLSSPLLNFYERCAVMWEALRQRWQVMDTERQGFYSTKVMEPIGESFAPAMAFTLVRYMKKDECVVRPPSITPLPLLPRSLSPAGHLI